MAWGTPLTAVANTALNASQWNASVRDNLLETAPAKASAAGQWFVSTAANSITQRSIAAAEVLTLQTTTTTGSYLNLTTDGPLIAVATSTQALVSITARMEHSAAAGQCYASYDITGATTLAANDNRALITELGAGNTARATITNLHTGLNAGTNTFHMQYKIITAGTGTFEYRKIHVMGM